MNITNAYGYYKAPKSTEDADRDKYNATIKSRCSESRREAKKGISDHNTAKMYGITVEELNSNRTGG